MSQHKKKNIPFVEKKTTAPQSQSDPLLCSSSSSDISSKPRPNALLEMQKQERGAEWKSVYENTRCHEHRSNTFLRSSSSSDISSKPHPNALLEMQKQERGAEWKSVYENTRCHEHRSDTVLRSSSSIGAWLIVGMLWCLCFLNYADRQVLSSVFPVLEKQFGFSKFQLGLIGSVFMWVYAAFSFVAGHLSDRLKRKSLLLTGCFFWSVVAIITGWCTRFWQFFTVRALEGLGESIYFPASNAMISDAHPEHNRSKALAFHQTGVYFGTVAGSWVGAFFAQHYGWYDGFYFFGGLGVLLALVFFFFLKEPPRASSQQNLIPLDDQLDIAAEHLQKKNAVTSTPKLTFLEALCYLVKRPTVICIVLAFISVNSVAAIFLTWLPTFLYEKFEMKLTMAGFYSVIFIQMASALTIPFFGWIADRLAQWTRHGRILLQMGSLLIGSVAIVMIGKSTTLPFLFVGMTLFGACKAGYDGGIFSALFDYIEPHVRGSGVGLMNTFGWLGGALGPLVVGAIATYGGAANAAIARMSSTIAASAGAYLLGMLLLGTVIVVSRNKKEKTFPTY